MARVVPSRRLVALKRIAFWPRMVLVRTKKKSNEKRSGTKLIKASYLLTANMAERKTAIPKIAIGRSNGVIRSLILPSTIILILSTIIEMIVTTPIMICFGRVKVSVKRLVKTRGKARRLTPTRKRETFSK